jgi:hypothetical protein
MARRNRLADSGGRRVRRVATDLGDIIGCCLPLYTMTDPPATSRTMPVIHVALSEAR